VARPKIDMTDDLRTLLRLARTRSGLTQAQAAGKSGISEVWWSQIETGIADKVVLDTLAGMLVTVNAPTRALHKLAREHVRNCDLEAAQQLTAIADAVTRITDWFGSEAGL
jgi:transcriptional regulator with XRE-family HTH domain